jgi:hypothetical protein
MAKLKAASRNKLPGKDFAGPDRSYPVEDKAHARAALSRVAANGSPKVKAEVRRKVEDKFPGIKQKSAAGREVEKRLAAKDKKW